MLYQTAFQRFAVLIFSGALLTACTINPPASSPDADMAQLIPVHETMEQRLVRLERDLASLRIDYSIVRPSMERLVSREGGLEERVATIEEAFSLATASVSGMPERPAPRRSFPAGSAKPAKSDTGQKTLKKKADDTAYGIHLASYRSKKRLQKGWQTVLQTNEALLAGLKPYIQAHKVPGRGVYERLLAGPVAGKSRARTICKALRHNGTWCQVLPLEK